MYLNGSPPRKKTLGGSMTATATATYKDGLTRNKTIIKAPLKSTVSLSTTSSTAALLFSQGSSTSISSTSSSSSSSSLSSAASSSSSSSTVPVTALIGNSHNHRVDSHHHQHQHPYTHSRSLNLHLNGNGTTTSGSNNTATTITTTSYSTSSGSSKRSKRNSWGARERAGMSFLIVIAFFAVFGLIIITELFMIDDKNHGGIVVLRHGNLNSRLGDSMPDYDNIKEDYDMLDSNLLMSDSNRIFQFRGDNKLKIHDRLSVGVPVAIDSINNDRVGVGVRGRSGKLASPGNLNSRNNGDMTKGGGGGNLAAIPWGQKLDSRIEQTLPHYPIGTKPTDGVWQVVNGTRFKFFIYSAFYDRRDGRMVRVIGATKTRGPEKVWCRLWYPYRDPKNHNHTKYYSATVMARVKIIRENWNLKYSACFVLCPLRAPGLEIPYSVSVVSRLRAPPGNVLLLRNTDHDNDFTNLTSSIPINQQIPDKMAVCVKPFHFNYDQALYLMEYLELNSLLGISHFTFYNHTLGPHSTCVLKHYINGNIPGNLTLIDDYDIESGVDPTTPGGATNHNSNIVSEFNFSNTYQKYQNNHHNNSNNHSNGSSNSNNIFNASTQHKFSKNHNNNNNNNNGRQNGKRRKVYNEIPYTKPTVTILPWDLRMRSQKEIRTEGLFAALNDCLYRNMYRYKYLALVDLDEFIMPRHNDTLSDLLGWLNRRYTNRNAGSYSFQNAFFYLQFADDSLLYETISMNPALRASLITQRKTKRRSKLHPQKQRSKYICKPESVVEAGNHFVWEFIPGKGSLNVPADAGILHHYRVCEFGGDDCIKSPSVVDRTATKYMKRLLARVDSVYNYLKKPCDLEDLPPAPTRPPPTSKRLLRFRNRTNLTTTPTTITATTSQHNKLHHQQKKKIKKKTPIKNDQSAVKKMKVKLFN